MKNGGAYRRSTMKNRDQRGRFVRGNKLNVGKKLSAEVKTKISESLKIAYKENRITPGYKGKRIPEDVRKKISESEKGKRIPEETRKRMSVAKKGIKFSESHKKRISEARRGKRLSLKHCLNLSKAHKGKVLSAEHKENIRRAISKFWDKKGRKEYRRSYHFCAQKKYKTWRTAVFEKDKYMCRICKKTICYLMAHHLNSWAEHPKLRYEVDNGMTVCKDCHKMLHDNQHGKNNY